MKKALQILVLFSAVAVLAIACEPVDEAEFDDVEMEQEF